MDEERVYVVLYDDKRIIDSVWYTREGANDRAKLIESLQEIPAWVEDFEVCYRGSVEI